MSKIRILVHVQVGYWLDEIFFPLFEKYKRQFEFSVFLDVDIKDDRARKSVKICTEHPLINKVFVKNISSKRKFNNLKSIKSLMREIDEKPEFELFIAANLSSPEMQFLRAEMLRRNIKPTQMQVAGLHHGAWETFQKLQLEKGASENLKSDLRKFLNFHRYPRYFNFLVKRILVRCNDVWFRYVFSYIFQRKIYPPRPFDRFPYLSDSKDRMFVIYEPDKTVIDSFFGENCAILVEPPYLHDGLSLKEENLLILFPGPLDSLELQDNLGNFYEVIERVLSIIDFPKVLVRWHPRESFDVKVRLENQFRDAFPLVHISDVSGDSLLSSLETVKVLIGGVSNALAVARRTSKTRKVVGVLGAGFKGIMSEKTQYSGEPDIHWVSSAEELDLGYFAKDDFKQVSGDFISFEEAVKRVV